MVFTVLKIETNIRFKSFKNKNLLRVHTAYVYEKNNHVSQNKNFSEKSGTVLYLCKSIVSLNRRQLDFHIYFCIQCVVIGFGSRVRRKSGFIRIWCWKKEEHFNDHWR